MTTLFDPLTIGNIELDNRIVIAPMTRSRADDEGIQPPYAAKYYGQRSSAGLSATAPPPDVRRGSAPPVG